MTLLIGNLPDNFMGEFLTSVDVSQKRFRSFMALKGKPGKRISCRLSIQPKKQIISAEC